MGYKPLISITLASNPAVLHGRPHTPDGTTLKDFVSEVKSNLRGEILALMGSGFNMPNNFMANFMQDNDNYGSSEKRRFRPVQLVG